jgi:hypothetical protein
MDAFWVFSGRGKLSEMLLEVVEYKFNCNWGTRRPTEKARQSNLQVDCTALNKDVL